MTTEAFEAEFTIEGLEEAARQLRELEGGLDDVNESAEAAGDGGAAFAAKLTAAVVTIQAAWGALSALYDGLKEVAAEIERTSGILQAFSGNVDLAKQRTGGLISELDLMIAKNTAVAAGLELTDEQFATLAVRATEFAQATGGDATEGFQNLIRALGEGPDALKAMGVSVEGATGLIGQQEMALAQLTEGYEDATVEANGLGGAITRLENALDDSQTEFQQAIEDSGLLDEGLANLRETAMRATDAFGVFGASDGPLSAIEKFALLAGAAFNVLTQRLDKMTQAVGRMQDMATALRNGDFSRIGELVQEQQAAMADFANESVLDSVFAEVAEGERRMGEARARRAAAAAEERPERRRPGGGASGPDGPTPKDDDIAAAAKNRERAARALAEELALSQQIKDHEAERLEAQREGREAEFARAEAMRQQTAEYQAQEKARQQAIEDERERIELETKAARAQTAVTEGMENIAGIAQRTIQLTEDGAMSTKEAFITAMDEWLKQFAIQEAWKGVADLAEAVSMTVTNAPGAATKYASAAMHFGIAAAAGGAAAAIPAQGGGASAGGGANRPEAVGGGNNGGGNTVVVHYNAPIAESLLGRQQRRADRAAQRRFG